MFHSRRQSQTESVDDFAQELRRLHSNAYSMATSANPGIDGNMDEIVAKARFEEAKNKELATKGSVPLPKKTFTPRGATPGNSNKHQSQTQTSVTAQSASSSDEKASNSDVAEPRGNRRPGGTKHFKCYNCGLGLITAPIPNSRQVNKKLVVTVRWDM